MTLIHGANILLILLVILSGCSLFEKKIETRYIYAEIEQPERPEGVTLVRPKFLVVTEDNLDEKLNELKKLSGGRLVFFAYSPKDYENQSYNMQQLRQYIQKQNEIIIYYEEVTENAPSVE